MLNLIRFVPFKINNETIGKYNPFQGALYVQNIQFFAFMF